MWCLFTPEYSVCISLKAFILTTAQFCPNNVFIALPFPSPHSESNPETAFNCLVSSISFNPEQIFCFTFHDLYVFELYRQLLCWVSLNLGLSDGSTWLDSSYAFWAGIPVKWASTFSNHRMWASSQCWQQKS